MHFLSKLSEKLGVTRAAVCRIEKNESIPTAETLMKLAEALDVDVDDILGTKLNDAVYCSIREKRILDNYRCLNQEWMDIMEALMELAVQAVEASESVPQTSAAHTSQSTSGTNPAQEGLKTGLAYTEDTVSDTKDTIPDTNDTISETNCVG